MRQSIACPCGVRDDWCSLSEGHQDLSCRSDLALQKMPACGPSFALLTENELRDLDLVMSVLGRDYGEGLEK